MTIAEVLLLDFDAEMSNTRRTLERVPEGNADYKPHQKSMPLGRLAMHCATLPSFACYILEDEGMDLATPKRQFPDLTFKSREDCLGQLHENSAKCRQLLAAASDEELSVKWALTYGERVIWNGSRAQTFRTMFFDHMIHHVAQLGVYLRLNDVPVPGLYGPSADEPFPA